MKKLLKYGVLLVATALLLGNGAGGCGCGGNDNHHNEDAGNSDAGHE